MNTQNRKDLQEAFEGSFNKGGANPEIDRNVFTQAGLSDKKMNIHLHLKDLTLQNLEESLKHSEEMISCLSPLIHEMLQKHQDNTQQDNKGQPCAFRFLLQFQKYDIEVLSSQSRGASTDATDIFDRL